MSVTYLTAAELEAAFVEKAEYLSRVDLSGAGSVSAVDGTLLVVCDTTGGAFEVDLPEIDADTPTRWNPVIINVGTNTLTVDPQASTINGQSGTQDLVTQYGGLDLHHDGSGYYAGNDVTP